MAPVPSPRWIWVAVVVMALCMVGYIGISAGILTI
jgi:hypothetical protein